MRRSNGVIVPMLLVRRLKPDARLPKRMSEHAAGLDLFACGDTVTIPAGEWKLIHTGIAVAVPIGYEGQIRPRSGWALKYGITVTNSPGTIDADYRGEIGIILHNLGRARFTVQHGDRCAQLVLCKVEHMDTKEVDTLPGTSRGEGGFGSTDDGI